MTALRAFVLHHRRLAVLLIALTLCMKALIPAGYMLGHDSRVLTVSICADSLGHAIARQITLPTQPAGEDHKAKSDSLCHFTALGHAALGGADPIQIALALAFVLALGFAAMAPARPRRLIHLRPPLRGPPALA